MAKTNVKGPPISPADPPGISQSDMDLPAPLTLPGTTHVAPFRTPSTRWRTRLREDLRNMVRKSGVAPDVRPYLERAEERADAAIGEIAQTTGACGPIAETQVVLGAKFAELAMYYLDRADPDTKQGRSDILLARACADTSRLNLSDALKTSAAIAAMKPPDKTDPLDAYLTAPAENATPEEPDDEPNP